MDALNHRLLLLRRSRRCHSRVKGKLSHVKNHNKEYVYIVESSVKTSRPMLLLHRQLYMSNAAC